jgi:hypothetical protein
VLDKLSSLSRLGLRTAKLGKDIAPLYEIVTAPAAQILNKWFGTYRPGGPCANTSEHVLINEP